MQIPPEAISELKVLFKEKYGISLSDAQVQEEALSLLRLTALAQGIPNALEL